MRRNYGSTLLSCALLGSLILEPAVGITHLRSRKNATAVTHTSQPYSLKLRNFNNVQYFADITIGGQVVPAIYDTGSFEILVLSKLCTTCSPGEAVYDQQASSTFRRGEATTAQHTYGSGPAISLKGLETVKMGPVSSPIVATDMPFWQVIDHHIDVWENARFSAIVGLGQGDRVPSGFADNGGGADGDASPTLLYKGGISEFGICLERSAPEPSGWLVLGQTQRPPTVFASVPVVGEAHWGVTLTNLKANSMTVGNNLCNPSCGAIVDSGTSLIAAPGSVLSALGNVLGNVKEDCSNLHELPPIQFNLGPHTFELPPKAYVLKVQDVQQVDQNVWDMLFSKPKTKVVDTCIPAFMQMEKVSQYGPVWILGMPFLRYYYTVFDRSEPKQLHVAPATKDCAPEGVGISASSYANATVGLAAGKKSGPYWTWPENFEPTTMKDLSGIRLPKWASPKMPKMIHL